MDERILANGLRRGEFYNYPADDLPALKRWILPNNVAMSIHAPLAKLDWYPDPPTWAFLCDTDKEKRELNLRMIEETARLAEDFGAEYVVIHFPSPVVSTKEDVGYARLHDIALASCERLAELSLRYRVPLHVEGFGPSPLLTPDFLGEVFSQFPFRYCFDTGHMHIAARRDSFNLYAFAKGIRPYLGSIHLWNTRGIDDYLAFRHVPVHPSQRAEEGWADIASILRTLGQGSLSCPIIFESSHSYPKALGDYDYRDGIKWVKELVATLS